MVFGYARVSTGDQNLSLQITALEKYGCDFIFSEKKSGVKERPELDKLMSVIRKDDVVVIWKIDRLARSLSELLSFSEKLNSKGINLVSLDGHINTTTAIGRMYFQIAGAFAEFERALIIERTKAGLVEAKKRGIKLGRKPGLTKNGLIKASAAKELYLGGNMRPVEICHTLKLSLGTLYRYLHYMDVKLRYNPGRRKKI